MMPFPVDAVPELPLRAQACPRCFGETPDGQEPATVLPTEQARTETMLLAHYRCDVHGIEWGQYYPIERAGEA